MATHSKYAQPLQPEKLETAAREVFIVHQRGDKNRGEQIEKIVQAATRKSDERDMIFLRAQRLQLDGIPASTPEKPLKKAVEASKPPARTPDPKPTVKTPPASSSKRQSAIKRKANGQKEEPMPF